MTRSSSTGRTIALDAVALAALVSMLAACAEPAGTSGTAPTTSLAAEPSTSIGDDESVSPVGFELVGVTITPATGAPTDFTMWLADERDLWTRGLTDVTDFGEADGMLFSFDQAADYQFFMWQTPMPLDVAFFDGSGMFVGSAAMEPCLDGTLAQCPRYSPGMPFLAAIEVPQGSLDDMHLGDGSRLTFELPEAPNETDVTSETT